MLPSIVRLVRTLAIAGAIVAALASAGIASAAPSKTEFVRKGDVLCVQTQRALVPLRARAEAAKSLPSEQKWGATANIWADQIVIQRRFVTRFRAIGTPAGDPMARSLVDALARGIPLAVRIQRGFAERDTVGLPKAISDYVTFTVNLNRRVVRYGFRVCGR